MDPFPVGQVGPVRLDELGDHFRRYRLRMPQAVQAMAQSLRRWGQCAPIVATLRQERPQVLDGFTRWEAARQVRGMTTLSVRLIERRRPPRQGGDLRAEPDGSAAARAGRSMDRSVVGA